MNDVKNVDMGNDDDSFTNSGSTDDTQLGLHGDDSTLVNQPTRMSDAGVVAASDFTDFDDDFARLSEEGSFESGAGESIPRGDIPSLLFDDTAEESQSQGERADEGSVNRSNGFVVGALLLAFLGTMGTIGFFVY